MGKGRRGEDKTERRRKSGDITCAWGVCYDRPTAPTAITAYQSQWTEVKSSFFKVLKVRHPRAPGCFCLRVSLCVFVCVCGASSGDDFHSRHNDMPSRVGIFCLSEVVGSLTMMITRITAMLGIRVRLFNNRQLNARLFLKKNIVLVDHAGAELIKRDVSNIVWRDGWEPIVHAVHRQDAHGGAETRTDKIHEQAQEQRCARSHRSVHIYVRPREVRLSRSPRTHP